MTVYAKPPVLPAWAESASPTDIVAPASPYVGQGWPKSVVPPPRQFFNWILNFVANAVRYYCQRGIPDYDAAESYAVGAVIRGASGVVYQAIAANTGLAPEGNPADWEIFGTGLFLALTGGTVDGTVVINAQSNYALYTQGIAGQYAQLSVGAPNVGNSFGLAILAGTNAGDIAFRIGNQADTQLFVIVDGRGQTYLYDATYNSSGIQNAATYEAGTFNMACPDGTLLSPNPVPVRFTRVGPMVTLCIPQFNISSNNAFLTLTGLPASLVPAHDTGYISGLLPNWTDNGGNTVGAIARINAGSTIAFARSTTGIGPSNWSSTLAKGPNQAFTITYLLN